MKKFTIVLIGLFLVGFPFMSCRHSSEVIKLELDTYQEGLHQTQMLDGKITQVVLGIVDKTGESGIDTLALQLSQVITAAKDPRVNVVSQDLVTQYIQSHAIPTEQWIEDTTLRELCQHFQADRIVYGMITRSGSRYQISISVRSFKDESLEYHWQLTRTKDHFVRWANQSIAENEMLLMPKSSISPKKKISGSNEVIDRILFRKGYSKQLKGTFLINVGVWTIIPSLLTASIPFAMGSDHPIASGSLLGMVSTLLPVTSLTVGYNNLQMGKKMISPAVSSLNLDTGKITSSIHRITQSMIFGSILVASSIPLTVSATIFFFFPPIGLSFLAGDLVCLYSGIRLLVYGNRIYKGIRKRYSPLAKSRVQMVPFVHVSTSQHQISMGMNLRF